MAFSLLTIFVGNTMLSDWQVIYFKNNPCYLPSPVDNGTAESRDTLNVTSSLENSNLNMIEWNIENCENKSTSSHKCFWNPLSRVTGDHCHTCYRGCLSKQTSLNFYQFSIGMLLVVVGSTLQYVFNFALLSDIVSPENQVNSLTLPCYGSLYSL